MTDGRHIAKCRKRYNSPINGPTGTQLRWSHPIMLSTCPPCCSCHGNGRCLARRNEVYAVMGVLRPNA